MILSSYLLEMVDSNEEVLEEISDESLEISEVKDEFSEVTELKDCLRVDSSDWSSE